MRALLRASDSPDETQTRGLCASRLRPLLVVMVAMMLGIFVQVSIWGGLFVVLGEFSELYEAVYHSAVNFPRRLW